MSVRLASPNMQDCTHRHQQILSRLKDAFGVAGTAMARDEQGRLEFELVEEWI